MQQPGVEISSKPMVVGAADAGAAMAANSDAQASAATRSFLFMIWSFRIWMIGAGPVWCEAFTDINANMPNPTTEFVMAYKPGIWCACRK